MSAWDYLVFDASEDGEGTMSWEALACVSPEREAAVRAEIAQLVAWAEAEFPQQRGALDEGGEWDWQLDVHDEGDASRPLRSLALTLTGTAAFAAAWARRWPD